MDMHDLAGRVSALSVTLADRQTRFLADLIRIRSYTGHERAAVDRTLEELRAIGCDEVWMDSAGNALGRIGHGPRVILYDAHLDTNEVADEREWPHPPLERVIEGEMHTPALCCGRSFDSTLGAGGAVFLWLPAVCQTLRVFASRVDTCPSSRYNTAGRKTEIPPMR